MKPQYATRLINMVALGGGEMLLADIVELEKLRGHRVLRPGDAEWFSRADWKPASILSVDHNRIRIVLIEARAQKTGAFSRLVENIIAAHFTPVVVEPHQRLANTLYRWGWKHRRIGHDESSENIWYPRS